MTQLQKLKEAKNLHDVATLLNFKPNKLSYLLYIAEDEEKYKTFEIAKRSGGTRSIAAPDPRLKQLQRNLSVLLLNCLDELREKKLYKDDMAHGFLRKKGIVTNAVTHRAKRFVFNIDISDFFGSINFGRLRGFLIKDDRFELNPNVATILAQIACRNHTLPQGSPCSPVISNLIGHILDVRLAGLAAKNGCRYSRYADDITFSTNKKEFPQAIAMREPDSHAWVVGAELEVVLSANNYSLNTKKTRMQYCDSRQTVTGLVVNRKVNVRSEYRRRVRAMVHRLFTTGQFAVPSTKVAATAAGAVSSEEPGSLPQLHGMLGFIDGVDQYNIRKHGLRLEELSEKEKTYRKFLLYKDFFLAERPVVLCEGKTDIIYLKNAVRQLAAKYPKLGEQTGENKFQHNVRFYKFADSSTGRILGLSGGGGDFQKFAHAYLSEVGQFPTHPIAGLKHPVIIMMDNDSGANAVCSYALKRTKISVDRGGDFFRLGENLYLVLTPFLHGEKPSTIEDFFDDAVKLRTVEGKAFDPGDEHDTGTHYGKAIFAKEVVEKYADEIDFNAFRGILSRIEGVMSDYYASRLAL
ncbi:retron Ec67 family RNA-directed DNA polymerase/endonuclease [Bordetella genomosp. 12]|uniref:RNA-directed DNA polymerase n=1 Tax=Bordetella genomosp. 12 TaxID=463035 RepID=A0A261VVM4_9BORD|nr:retron Ec67 family RNA-directed DNA polymerase/endonuclease [Bordetella genomosp. 12]OZI77660.1 hypothetical protein CAL22_03785 [Bordetella genomosp. 12]